MTTQVNNLIAKIESLGVALKGANDTKVVVLKLKEANGKTNDWTSFHVGLLDEYQVGDVIEIEPKLVFKDGNKWPFRNIERVIGKRDASEINTLDVLAQQPSKQPEASGSQSINGTYDQGKAIERQSIEGQTSLKLVVELFKAGCSVDDLLDVVAAVIKAAVPLEEHLASLNSLNINPALSMSNNTPAHTNGASITSDTRSDFDSYKMETIGDLFTAVQKKYKRTPPDIFSALDVESKDDLLLIATPAEAWDQLQGLWNGPATEESLPED